MTEEYQLTHAEEELIKEADYISDIKAAGQLVERLLAERTHVLREEIQEFRDREARWLGLATEVARWHPGCVMPESYSPSMYGLAQATVALIEDMGINETQVAMEDEKEDL